MIVHYKHNDQDQPILNDIKAAITESLDTWYEGGAHLDVEQPEIRSYRNCFMLRYPITCTNGEKKTVLVKIRRNPKMDSLSKAIHADIHANIPTEYSSLEFVFSHLAEVDEDFGVIRPLDYIEKYHAIVMEEYPSRTLRALLLNERSSKNGAGMSELVDAATKTGRWLYYFHHHVHTPEEKPYSTQDILEIVKEYATRLESCSRGRVRAQLIVEAFARKLENVRVESMVFSQSHADMTVDNVLYSNDHKVCIIDIKTRLAPIYSDLGLILTHPETFKPQIFSGGSYLSDSILKVYREAIIAGYFKHKAYDEVMVKLFSAIKILDKWNMYEELMSKYKGVKHLLAVPVGPFVTGYFQNVFKKHLDSIRTSPVSQVSRLVKPADPAV